MTDSVTTALDRLGWLTFWGRHLTAPPSEVVPAINDLLRALAPAWDGRPTAFLGPTLDNPTPGDAGSHDYRAAVLIPDGIGVLVWGAAERETARRLRSGEADLLTAEFIPFRRCPATVQTELLSHLEPLLERLYRQLTGGKEGTWRVG